MQLQMPCIYRCNRYHYRMLSISIDFQLITIIFFTKQFANGFQFLLIFDGNKNEMLSIINMENTNLIFEKTSFEIGNSSRNCSPAAMPNQVTGLTFLSLSRGDCARYSHSEHRKNYGNLGLVNRGLGNGNRIRNEQILGCSE